MRFTVSSSALSSKLNMLAEGDWQQELSAYP